MALGQARAPRAPIINRHRRSLLASDAAFARRSRGMGCRINALSAKPKCDHPLTCRSRAARFQASPAGPRGRPRTKCGRLGPAQLGGSVPTGRAGARRPPGLSAASRTKLQVPPLPHRTRPANRRRQPGGDRHRWRVGRQGPRVAVDIASPTIDPGQEAVDRRIRRLDRPSVRGCVTPCPRGAAWRDGSAQSSRWTRSIRSCRSCASIESVAIGLASSRRSPMGSPVSSQKP